MKLKSALLSGAGNTFHIYYNVTKSFLDKKQRPGFVVAVCSRFAADGVVFLSSSHGLQAQFAWDFYNSDGSQAEMCGNATRCVGYFVQHILKSSDSKIHLKTSVGLLEIHILEYDMYKVFMPPAKVLTHKHFFYCNTGVPHVVIELSQAETFENWKERCREIRTSADFFSKGTNVTLIRREADQNTVKAISFERGVEDFTLACGTGAVAAALFMNQKYKNIKTTVEMPGGTLNIDMSDLKKPVMVGPVKHLEDCVYEFST